MLLRQVYYYPIFNDRHLRAAVMDCWASRLVLGGTYHVIGIPRGGVPWAQALALRLGNSTWGTPGDAVPKGSKLLIVDDVLTTGASLRLGMRNCGVFVVVNRSGHEDVGGVDNLHAWAVLHLPDNLDPVVANSGGLVS